MRTILLITGICIMALSCQGCIFYMGETSPKTISEAEVTGRYHHDMAVFPDQRIIVEEVLREINCNIEPGDELQIGGLRTGVEEISHDQELTAVLRKVEGENWVIQSWEPR